MKAILKYIPFVLLFCVLTSCEDVVDIKLKSSANIPVLEANYDSKTELFTLKASRTVDYYNVSTPSKIINASVFVDNGSGTMLEILHQGDGKYEGQVPANFGNTYTAEVTIDGKKYVSKSELYSPVLIKELSITQESDDEPDPFGGDEEENVTFFNVNFTYEDPSDAVNFYLLDILVDGKEASADDQFNDAFNNGQEVEEVAYSFDTIPNTTSTTAINVTDNSVITVRFRHVDRKVNAFFSSLSQVQDAGIGSAAPANPRSNWDNGALGYFSASAVNEKEITYTK